MARPNSEKYAKVFQSCKGNAIKSIQVQDKIAAMKIALTLWDETLMTSSLPGWFCTSENKEFIFYYVDEVLAPALTRNDPLNQATIDKILDQLIANANFSSVELEELATNVNWAVSVAVCKAGAHYKKKSVYMYVAELAVNQHDGLEYDFHPDFIAPTPYLNVASGRLSLKNRLADQHLVISHLVPRSFNDATRVIQRVFDEYSKTDVDTAFDDGDEESYTPNIKKIKNCLSSLEKTLAHLGLQDQVLMGVNIGASKFYAHDKKTYSLDLSEENSDNSVEMSAEDLYKAYISLWREFNCLAAFEDMFHVDDDKKYSSKLTRQSTGEFVIAEVKYDYDKALRNEVCNCLHLKVGQIGSVTKCIGFVRSAKFNKCGIILSSHDSCETSEPFLADFCVGLSVDLIKIGVSCFTSACNICNRVRKLEVERAEENWRYCPQCHARSFGAWLRNESPREEKHKTCCDETAKKLKFKVSGLQGY